MEKEDKTLDDKRFFTYRGGLYPSYIREWRAGRFVFEFASEFCKGDGLDIGADLDRQCAYPGAIPVNITIDDDWDAMRLPEGKYDYIFSSMTLEHLSDPVAALELWKSKLKPGGTLFLYLPHPDMIYWRPENNRRHKWMFHPKDMHQTLEELGFKYVIHSERDLYWGFCVVGVLGGE